MKLFAFVRRYRWRIVGRWRIRRAIKSISSRSKVKIIVGSGETSYEGWIATDLPHFNILIQSEWKYYFGACKIDNLLAEHVLEHFTEEEVEGIVGFAYRYMKPGGCFRIAVPDGFNPDPAYIDDVSPKGVIGSVHGHQSLWNYKMLAALAVKNNFNIIIHEHHDEDGKYILIPFSDNMGLISRTGKNESLKSLVVDFIKPELTVK